MVMKRSAVDSLQSLGRAKQEIPGPITISGVGDQKLVCEDGVFSVRLPLGNGRETVLSGLCLNRVTAEFPVYTLREVEKDVKKICKKHGGETLVRKLPKLASKVGGETD